MRKKKSIVKSGHSKERMLTPKQERFVQELIKGNSQRQAYKIAYPASKKWKQSAIDSQASRLANNSKVSARIEELTSKTAEKVTYDAAKVKDLIVNTMMAIVQADVGADDVDGRAVKNKRWDSKNRTIYEHYDKIEAANMLIKLLGIESESADSGVHIHLHSSEEYDG